MAESPFLKAIQRVADDNALLLPAERAMRIRLPLTIRRVPETDADGTLAGSSSSPGEVSGYYELGLDSSLLPGLITSRIVFATSPLRVNGGASADLGAVNITLSINPATGSDPGSMSSADFTKLGTIQAGAQVTNAGAGLIRVGDDLIIVSSDGSIVVNPDNIQVGVINSAQHGIHTDSTLHALATQTTHGFMPSTDKLKLDNILNAVVPTPIQPDDTGAAGVATTAARADHRHAAAADVAGAILIGDSAAEGASTSFSRADHRHSLAVPATPASVGAANSAGASTAAARADHVHAHAYQQYMGANTLTGTTTTRYLSVGFNTGTASANILDMTVTKAFKIDSLAMIARVGGTAGQTISATIRKNAAAVGTAVLTTASDALTGSSTFTAVSFAVNDTWGIEITKSGAIASSPTDIVWSVGMTPP